MSSILMWSNLVFPLAHLNILISAEFSLFSFFFFTAQHSEPYVIAGLMIVLKTLSFNSTGIFLSHITPDTSFHIIHQILIILFASACETPSLAKSDPMYLKDVTVGSSASTIFTVVPVSFVGLGKYSVFVLLIFSSCLSKTTHHISRSSSISSRVIAHRTRSSANIITQGGSPVIVALEDVTFVFEYWYEFTFLPAIWDTICHYSYVNSSCFSSATTIIASIGKSYGPHALFLPLCDSCFLISVSFTEGIGPCTGSVGSNSSRSISTFSRFSNDYFHLALISSSSIRIVPLLSFHWCQLCILFFSILSYTVRR